MANPSLQIGNENWAIKEDNLLGYSTAGTRFVPQPITMTRASAGTRVNSEGLVETVELLGSELTTPLDFTTWTNSSSTDITANSFTTAGSGQGVYFNLTTNKVYKINVSGVTGDISLRYRDGGGSGTVLGAFDTDLYFDTSGLTSPNIYIRALSATTATVTSVSIKESTKNDLARVDYDGSVSSLLVEPERKNEVTYSEDFSNAAWTKHGNTAVASDTVISPDGTQNGDTVTGLDGTGGNDLRNLTGIDPASKTYTGSVYLKGSGTMVIRLSNTIDDSADTQITLTSSWARYTLTHTFNATSGDLLWFFDDASSSTATTYDIWGAQVEEGSYATSYIPTDGTTVTRVKDLYSKTGISDLINSEEGVLFLEIAALSDDGTNRYLSISSSITPSDDYIYFRFMSTSNRVLCRTRVGGSTINTLEKTISDTTAFNKYAIKWKSGDYAFWINGVEELVDTSATVFGADVLNQIKFDFPVGSGTFPSKVKHLQVYKTALSDSELTALTT